MSLMFRSSCGDTYTAAQAADHGWTATGITIQTGRVAGNCFNVNNATCPVALGSSSAEVTMHGAFWVANLSNQQDFWSLREGGTTHVTLRLNTNGSISVTRNGTVLWTSTATALINSSTWYHLGFRVKVHDTAGEFDVYLNGVLVAGSYVSGTATTQDTRNGGTGVIDTLAIFGNGSSNTRHDDIHIWTGNDFKGDTRVIGQVPNAAGNYAQWTPNASTNVSRIQDSTPDNDTTYNSTSTPSQRDSFGFASLGVGSTATVHALAFYAMARKDDAGARSLQISARLSSTDSDGGSVALTTSYTKVDRPMETDPVNTGAWTLSNAQAAEGGYVNV